MSIRVRFAPSPTGQVHIGNIRAAIFNWLFARNQKGKFLLRIEDTDLQRSTPEAIEVLLRAMQWLDLDYDEEALYQSSQRDMHLEAAEKMLAENKAYKDGKGSDGEAIIFRIPWNAEDFPGVVDVGSMEQKLHPDEALQISHRGLSYANITAKGKAAPAAACLAGFKDLQVYDENEQLIFTLQEHIDEILNNDKSFELPAARKITYNRRAITYDDLVKGKMSKPLDSIKDLVIVRSDGNPVFHLANVIDDITQNITHIIRGDDHVENTFRHIFLFASLNAEIPHYAHLPMIVNNQGKPYSKRDGDAFVGDFREKGFLPQTLFNYLSLLGWSPGDDREKMSRAELIEAFSLERCLQASAQMDLAKMTNLNGIYIAEMPEDDFYKTCQYYLEKQSWKDIASGELFQKVCSLMQSRLKKFEDISMWKYFFTELPDYDEKLAEKQLKGAELKNTLAKLAELLQNLSNFNTEEIEQAIKTACEESDFAQKKLNLPLRISLTGTNTGAGIYETIEVLGKEKSLKRLKNVVVGIRD